LRKIQEAKKKAVVIFDSLQLKAEANSLQKHFAIGGWKAQW